MTEQAIVPYQAREVVRYSLGDIERMSIAFAKSGYFGVRDPASAFVLMMLADANDMHPVSAFLDFDVIKGNPTKKSSATHRDFLKAGGRVVWHEHTDTCASATFYAPGSQTGRRFTWTLARAAKAGLAGKDIWKQYPDAMLRARVLTEGITAVFPGATSGLPSAEDLDMHQEGPSPVSSTRQVTDQSEAPVEETPVEQKTEKRLKAEAWVSSFKNAMQAADTTAKREAFHNDKAARAIERLKKDHPDLHGEVADFLQDLPELGQDPTPEEDTGEFDEAPLDQAPPDFSEVEGDPDRMTLARACGIIDLAEMVIDVRSRAAEIRPQLPEADRPTFDEHVEQRITHLQGGAVT